MNMEKDKELIKKRLKIVKKEIKEMKEALELHQEWAKFYERRLKENAKN